MITQKMTLLDVVEKYPKTEDVFHQYDTVSGECVLCNNLFDSIENVAEKYKLNLDELLSKLNYV
ncbi:hypothetical protein I6U48_14530 [Clostridium sp. PL3]|uniref:DUF1858 domain-containing protein n=1 Tax=Clostridium thailandense TaxID=2794346 RepID=A0A949TJR6_9CLOT|nr:hypothetical protein [Clostridium thailandense]MBV7274119.1 hypothetical protein [Clostridium thailandense]